jgi:fucose 4-O-acetylase-like acetyltransferase
VDVKGIPVYRAIEPVAKPLDGYWQMGLLVAPLPLYWGSLFYPNAAAEKMRIETFVIVAIPTVVRLIWLLVTFIRNQRSAGAEIRVLPQGSAQILAFLAATLVFVFGGLLFQDDHTGLGRYDGLAFFAIYLVCMSTSAAWSLQKTKEAERQLRRFVAMDIDALKRRVQR